jgi:outer membrane protein OmpA-like peptidoglycan-associated protein
MKLKTTLLAAASMMVIAPAAHAYEGLYGAIGAGLNYMGDQDLTNDHVSGGGAYAIDTDVDYDHGIGVYAAIGKAWGNNLRTELEFSYRDNSVDSIAADGGGFTGWPAGTISGSTTTTAFLANFLYDFGTGGSFTPYLGAGVGVANVDHDIIGSDPIGVPAPHTIAYGPNQWGVAYQGIAGVAVGLTEGLVLDLSYRYFAVARNEYDGFLGGAPAEFRADNKSHSLFAGLRWNFGAAPAPIQYKDCWDGSSVPVAASCPPQSVENTAADLDPIQFTVYFDYDKSNLTPQASTLVREAASRALENDIETVVVAGNTDTSGGSAYNQSLSERRARAVRDGLIANGVPADNIRLEAFGETNLAKDTADGVREPLNRRADVVISFE